MLSHAVPLWMRLMETMMLPNAINANEMCVYGSDSKANRLLRASSPSFAANAYGLLQRACGCAYVYTLCFHMYGAFP